MLNVQKSGLEKMSERMCVRACARVCVFIRMLRPEIQAPILQEWFNRSS